MNTCESRRHYLNCHKIYILNQLTNISFILEWRRPFQMVSHTNYNLNVNEGFIMFLTSKLITCFIDGFISEMKSQSIASSLMGSAHIYWSFRPWRWSALNMRFVDKRPSRKQEQYFFLPSWARRPTIFSRIPKISKKTLGNCPNPYLPPPTSL